MNAVIRIDGRAGTARRRAIAQFLKAAFDRVAAAIALSATAPLFALVSLAILCELSTRGVITLDRTDRNR